MLVTDTMFPCNLCVPPPPKGCPIIARLGPGCSVDAHACLEDVAHNTLRDLPTCAPRTPVIARPESGFRPESPSARTERVTSGQSESSVSSPVQSFTLAKVLPPAHKHPCPSTGLLRHQGGEARGTQAQGSRVPRQVYRPGRLRVPVDYGFRQSPRRRSICSRVARRSRNLPSGR